METCAAYVLGIIFGERSIGVKEVTYGVNRDEWFCCGEYGSCDSDLNTVRVERRCCWFDDRDGSVAVPTRDWGWLTHARKATPAVSCSIFQIGNFTIQTTKCLLIQQQYKYARTKGPHVL